MKLKCIKSYKSGEWLTEGKIYEIKDGYITYDDGYRTDYIPTNNINSIKIKDLLVEIKEEDNKVNKFKVGDRVRILDGSKIKDYAGGWVNYEMSKHIGTEHVISTIECNNTKVRFDDISYVWDIRGIKHINNNKSIHITVDGTTTNAVLKDDKDIVKRVKAELHPDDEYNFETGINIVMDRLFDRKCKKVDDNNFVKAKVGDRIRIIKDSGYHIYDFKIGDIQTVSSIDYDSVNTDNYNSLFDKDEEYEIISSNNIDIMSFTTDELLAEIKRRIR